MLNLNSIMIGSEDPKKLATFYEKVFGRKADMVEGNWHGWSVGNSFFSIGEHSDVKGTSKESKRIMFNFETKEIKEEFKRIKGIGAKVVKALYDMSDESGSDGGRMEIATFEDPDGNYFQLMTPWESK